MSAVGVIIGNIGVAAESRINLVVCRNFLEAFSDLLLHWFQGLIFALALAAGCGDGRFTVDGDAGFGRVLAIEGGGPGCCVVCLR